MSPEMGWLRRSEYHAPVAATRAGLPGSDDLDYPKEEEFNAQDCRAA